MPETLGSRTCLHCLRPLPGPTAVGGRRCRYCGTFLRRPSGQPAAVRAVGLPAAVPPAAAAPLSGRRSRPRRPFIPAPDWSALGALAAGPAIRRAPVPEPPPVWHSYAAFTSMSLGVLSWIYLLWKFS